MISAFTSVRSPDILSRDRSGPPASCDAQGIPPYSV